MELYAFGFGVFIGFALAVSFVHLTPPPSIVKPIMREAYERGHAVQCLGQTGYHWECEEEKQ